MARPKDRLPGKDLVVRKLVLEGIGNECVGTDEKKKQYKPLVLLGPRMAKEMDAALKRLGAESFLHLESITAMNLCRVSRWDPSTLEVRPDSITD